MVFLGIYRAVYDYVPQGDNELPIKEGDLLYVVEKSTEDDWWKAKKKAGPNEEEEPEGLIPNNYVEEAAPIKQAKALYDYTRQTDEELSFAEDAILDVYDTSDPDWTLVGAKGEYGFVPANYIELTEEAPAMPARPKAVEPAPEPAPEPVPEPQPEPEPEQLPTPSPPSSPVQQSTAAAIAGIIQQKTGSTAPPPQRTPISPPPNLMLPPRRPQYTPDESDEEHSAPPPSLPRRPESQQMSPPPTQLVSPRSPRSPPQPSPAFSHRPSAYDEEERRDMPNLGYHLYNIHEMISHMGKNKKMPTTLGINIPKGLIMISPEKSRDGPQQEWTAEKLTHYSIEGKHVFMELVKPSRSIDFHAGAKDTAQEIVSALGELAGAARAEGLREVLAAGSGSSNVQRKGQILYDFMAQGDDEVSVAIGDEVVILDDSKSDEWWMVRRLKNGKEGVVPSSYVEIVGTMSAPSLGLEAGLSTVERNRREEERLAKEAEKRHRKEKERESKAHEVGPGLHLPERHSSRTQGDVDIGKHTQKGSRDSKVPSTSKSKPDPSRVRTWTDRTGSFKVEAEFIGLKEGKIHLHKTNGVKIAVPVPKMSIEDLEYVEGMTGVSLEDDKPLSDIKRKSTQRQRPSAGLSVEKKPEYDWFDFFLQCGVNPQICERYASSFVRDQMGEENLPDITTENLRTLGLKEGDILRVMKFLDNKFGRTQAREARNVSFGGASVIPDGNTGGSEGATGGLFSGPGGVLRNNTRKSRPAPAVETSNTVDPKAFEQKADESAKKSPPADATATPLTNAPVPEKKVIDDFEDNAWEVKPSKNPAPESASTPQTTAASASTPATTTAPQQPTVTGAMAELSLLTPPLQPTPAPQPAPQQQPATAVAPAPQPPQGATPGLFEKLANQPPAPQTPQQQSFAAPRQRPQAPQQMQTGNSLIAPPPARASSAPQNFQQQSAFGPPPLQPQLTGYQAHMHTQVAPPGQSLQDQLNQQRMQQTGYGQMQMMPQPTGFQSPAQNFGPMPNGMQMPQIQQPQPTGFGAPQPFQAQPTGFQAQPTGFQAQPTGFQPQLTGFQPQPQYMAPQPTGSPFADPPRPPFVPQPTGMQNSFTPTTGLQPQQTGINAFLPPALQPQRTGFANPGTNGFQAPPPPPIPQGASAAPLVPQKTGPPPPVRFGVQPGAKKLTPQPTGKRANLSNATPENPFGF